MTFPYHVFAEYVTIDQLMYNLNASTSEATVIGAESGVSIIENLSIPETITHNNQTYTVTSVGGFAFGVSDYNPKLVGTLELPKSLTEIEDYAFYDCSGITGSLIIPENVRSIGRSAFAGCSGFEGNLILPSSLTTIGRNAFASCSGFVGSLVIPEHVTTISNGAFSFCSGFNGSLTLPDGLTTIGESAFMSCFGFVGSLILPEHLETLGGHAFQSCSGFTGTIVIPKGLNQIEEGVFWYCKGISGELIIPENITKIGDDAFSQCNIKKVQIGSSVTTIGAYALFRNEAGSDAENAFDEIICNATIPPEIKSTKSPNPRAFVSGCYRCSKLLVPPGSLNAYKEAYEWKEFQNIEPFYSIDPTGISLDRSTVSMKLGEKLTLIPTITPVDATDKTVAWKSDNEAVATIGADGTVTAVSVGVATITASCGKASAACKVTVNPVSASSVTISAQDLTLLVGQVDQLTATVTPDNTTDKTVAWKSDNESVATVGTDGTVTAVSIGVANITATCGEVSAICKVTVGARPDTPKQYLKKGNGTSCTFVVLMNLSDEDLNKQGYKFAYGYTDMQGVEHIITVNDLRYCHTGTQIYNDMMNDFWVCAFWKKDDGSIIIGARRYIDGRVDNVESTILKDYLSRSIDITHPDDWIRPTSSGARINLLCADNTILYVHTINGVLVFSKSYDNGMEVNEEISKDDFTANTYIVTVQSGDIMTSKKIIIR